MDPNLLVADRGTASGVRASVIGGRALRGRGTRGSDGATGGSAVPGRATLGAPLASVPLSDGDRVATAPRAATPVPSDALPCSLGNALSRRAGLLADSVLPADHACANADVRNTHKAEQHEV